MIDYNATLQFFFKEVVKYLEKLRKNARDQVYADRITAAIDIVYRMAKDPKKYASYQVRCSEGAESGNFAEAFIPAGTSDNRAYLSFSSVTNSMGDLNSPHDFKRQEAQKKLLTAKKFFEYRNSTNILKDVLFKFKSLNAFGVKKDNVR